MMLLAGLLLSIATPTAIQPEVESDTETITKTIIRNGEGATVVMFEVDVKGRVISCSVTESSGSTELDDKACGTISESAKFQPWHGPDRSNIRKFRTRIVWRMTE